MPNPGTRGAHGVLLRWRTVEKEENVVTLTGALADTLENPEFLACPTCAFRSLCDCRTSVPTSPLAIPCLKATRADSFHNGAPRGNLLDYVQNGW